MTATPRWLQRIRQRDRLAARPVHSAPNSKPRSRRLPLWLAIATLVAAVSGIVATLYFAYRSEDTEIQEQYSRLVVQTFEYLPKVRTAEERTSARLADIQTTLTRPELTDQERQCLEDMRIMATGELDAIQSISRKLNNLAFNSMRGPPSDMSAADLAEQLRNQRMTVNVFTGRHAERYAQFNSERVRECIEKPI